MGKKFEGKHFVSQDLTTAWLLGPRRSDTKSNCKAIFCFHKNAVPKHEE